MLRNIVRRLRGDGTVWKKLNLRLDNFDSQLKLIRKSEDNLLEHFTNNDLTSKSLNIVATKLELLANQVEELKINQNETFKRLDCITNELHLIHEVNNRIEKQKVNQNLVQQCLVEIERERELVNKMSYLIEQQHSGVELAHQSLNNIEKKVQSLSDELFDILNQQVNQQLVLKLIQEINDRVLQQQNYQELIPTRITSLVNEIQQVRKMGDLIEEHQADLNLCFLKIIEGLEKFNERPKKDVSCPEKVDGSQRGGGTYSPRCQVINV